MPPRGRARRRRVHEGLASRWFVRACRLEPCAVERLLQGELPRALRRLHPPPGAWCGAEWMRAGLSLVRVRPASHPFSLSRLPLPRRPAGVRARRPHAGGAEGQGPRRPPLSERRMMTARGRESGTRFGAREGGDSMEGRRGRGNGGTLLVRGSTPVLALAHAQPRRTASLTLTPSPRTLPARRPRPRPP